MQPFKIVHTVAPDSNRYAPGAKLVVRNLAPEITDWDLWYAFSFFGFIMEVYIPKDGYVHVYICMYAHVCECVFVEIHSPFFDSLWKCIYKKTGMSTCIYACMHMCVSVCLWRCILLFWIHYGSVYTKRKRQD